VKPAIVVKNGKYLHLIGPFEYADWRVAPQEASVMGACKASQWALVYGATSILAEGTGAFVLDEKDKAAPSTKRDGFLFGGIPGLGG
jgi:hypothetical protein